MKLLSLLTCVFLACSSLLQADPLHPPDNAKITKNEAEHIALKSSPGARVTNAKLETVQGQLVWSLQLVASGGATKAVAVDAVSGRIVGAPEKKP